MTNSESMSLPVPAFMGGKKAITLTPVVGKPPREYAEMFIPGEEQLEDGELRVTVLGSGNPWNTRAQASASVMVEVGNPFTGTIKRVTIDLSGELISDSEANMKIAMARQ
jgi:ribonuclease Z